VSKGQVHVHVGPLEDRPVPLEEAAEHPVEVRRRGREGGAQKVFDARLELGGKDGGEHLS